ncbi:MAG: hypothetical protein AAF481_09610 [Acidobacteriota bacterium]
MDQQRLQNAYVRLQALDDRLTHKVRPRSAGTFTRPGPDRLEENLRHLAEYTVELKDILHEVLAGLARRQS